jgi:hypothetical protein
MSYEGMWLHNDVVVEAALVDMSIAFVAGMRWMERHAAMASINLKYTHTHKIQTQQKNKDK